MATKKKTVKKPTKVISKKKVEKEVISTAPATAEEKKYISEQAQFVKDILKARRKDITKVFDVKREIINIKNSNELTPEAKAGKLKELADKLKVAKAEAKASKNAIRKTVKEAINHKFYDLRVCFSYQQMKYQKYLDELNKLRRDGENKAIALRNEIQDIVLNKQIEKNEKKELIQTNLKALKEAKANAKLMKKEVKFVLREATAISKFDSKQYMRLVKAVNKHNNELSRSTYNDMCKTINEMHDARVAQLKKESTDKKALAVDLKAEKIAYSSKINEAKTARADALTRSKELRYNSFMNRYAYTGKLKHDHHPVGEWFQFKFENYIANFNFTNWLIKNALYVVILVVFAALIGISYTMPGDGLLAGKNILGALVQISPKIFFALGVAGLILLGGTDLSIGRLTGVGVSFSLMILSPYLYKDQVTDSAWWPFIDMPIAGKVICAILISVLVCTLFTSFAGFFTAKFKMHPFISTLA
ncbi:MAG: hypothetical protein MJ213_03940, partial [Bacilli bacterium]|nr:hypothetical protein [Bacilli bacterium]